MAAPGRVPSLDGLRAISIVLVLFGHFVKTADWMAPLRPVGVVAGFGVRVFFVISGYLISTLLFHELSKSNRIALGKFYFRRTFRIFPAFYVTVAVVALLDRLGVVTLLPGDLLHAVTYTTNYHYDRSWYLGHLWSLAVEEQFYMLWPALLLLLGRSRGLALAALFVVIAPFVRIATLKLGLGAQAGIGESFQTVGDSIATGCLLAGFRERLEASTAYMKLLDSPAFVLVPTIAIAIACVFVPYASVDLIVGMTVQNLAVAATVHHAIRHHDSIVGRFLNARIPVYIGTLSYSLYLWQQIFLHHGDKSALDTPAPLNLAIAIAAALVSFYAIEQPCLRWRERLEPHLFPKRVPA